MLPFLVILKFLLWKLNSTLCELQNIRIELVLSLKAEETVELTERKQLAQGQVAVGLISQI